MPTTVSRSRGRQGVHSGAQGAAGDHMRKIMATLITATVVIIFVLVATKAGRYHRCCHAAFHAVLRRGARARRPHRVGAAGPGGHRPHRHDARTPGDGAGRAPCLRVRHAGVPDHPYRDRDPGPAVACYRRRHSFPVAVPDLLHRSRHDRLGLDRPARGNEHPPQAVHRARPGLAMAGHSLQLLRGVRVRGPARAARRPGGQAVRRLELRVRDRGNRPRPRGQVPGHLAAAEGERWLVPQRRPGQAVGLFAAARRGHEHGAGAARRDGPGAARRPGRAGAPHRRPGPGPWGPRFRRRAGPHPPGPLPALDPAPAYAGPLLDRPTPTAISGSSR